jgi:ABC-type branched-subunit amino acid transport system substrate-binding protein
MQQRISRRLSLQLASSLVLGAAHGHAASPIKVGMSTALSGPAQGLGQGMRAGVQAYFELVNQRGGIQGRPLELVALDDRYEPSQAAPNVRRLIDQEGVIAIVGNVGTPTAVVTVPIVNEKKVPFFGAFTGAGVLRKNPPDRYVFNLRASYADETAEMVRGLLEDRRLKPEDVGFFTQDDAYGDAGYQGALKALTARGLRSPEMLPHGRYARNTLDIEDGLARLLDPRVRPRAVIVVGAYQPVAKFIRLAKHHGLRALFANVSFVGSSELSHALGPDAEGVVITQVVPHWSGELPVLKEYRASGLEANFVSLEGFIVGRAFSQVLAAAGTDLTPEGFVRAAESGVEFDLGLEKPQALSATRHGFSTAVWPTVIKKAQFQAFADWRELKTP